MPIITIPKILQERLTEEGAKALVDILDKVEEQGTSHALEINEERFEKRLTIEIANVRSDIKVLGERFDKKIDTSIAHLRTELKTDIANTKADLIKWMFLFWIGQVAT